MYSTYSEEKENTHTHHLQKSLSKDFNPKEFILTPKFGSIGASIYITNADANARKYLAYACISHMWMKCIGEVVDPPAYGLETQGPI
jgi:hypothetical protein